MPTLVVRDAEEVLRYLAVEGVGSEIDPFRPLQRTLPSVFDHFYTAQVNVSQAGDIVQLPSFALQVGVWIKALTGNGGNIYLGGPDVNSDNGFELDKNESLLVRIDELSKLYITASSNNEGVCLIGL